MVKIRITIAITELMRTRISKKLEDLIIKKIYIDLEIQYFWWIAQN
jgi:hypothetical protein